VAFEPGHKKVGGRQAGSENKISNSLRASISAFLEDNFNKVQQTFDKANEREKLTFYVQLLRFALPQLQSVEMTSELETLTDEQLNILYEKLRDEMHENMNRDEREE